MAKPPAFKPSTSRGGKVVQIESGAWRLSIPPGEQGQYRLAQLDDYGGLIRRHFPWSPPLKLDLEGRACAAQVPGTWGFGLWNDPFAFSMGFGGGTRRFPALPNTAWFFFASPPNYLALREEAPAQGFLAQTFKAPNLPACLLALGAAGAPLLLWPWMAGKLRPVFSRIIPGASFRLPVDPRAWHAYSLEWRSDRVAFQVDGEKIGETSLSPNGPLGLVLWIDNQYVAYPPDGRLAYGTLPAGETNWIEIRSLSITA